MARPNWCWGGQSNQESQGRTSSQGENQVPCWQMAPPVPYLCYYQYREKEVLGFRLGVEDRFNVINWMEAEGVDSITDAAPLQDEAGIQKAYPEIKEEAQNRPVGPERLLISMTKRRLHVEGGRAVDATL